MKKNLRNVDNKMNKQNCSLINETPNNLKKKFKFLERSLKNKNNCKKQINLHKYLTLILIKSSVARNESVNIKLNIDLIL